MTMGNTIVDTCHKLRDNQINSEIDAGAWTGDDEHSRQQRKQIKSRAGRALTLSRLSESLEMLGLQVVAKDTMKPVNLVEECEETIDGRWVKTNEEKKKAEVGSQKTRDDKRKKLYYFIKPDPPLRGTVLAASMPPWKRQKKQWWADCSFDRMPPWKRQKKI